MNYSLSQNLTWLKENKEAFLEKLNSMLDTPSGLTIHSSWDEISNFLQSMQTYLMDLSGGAVEQMERFLNNTIETAISISATAINDYSFYEKTSVTKIKADNATTVGNYAFYNCNNLVEANMPKVTTIGDYAFYNSKITTLENMPSIDTIGLQTFDTCTCLTGTITLNNMTSIGTSAFKQCKNIEKIIITNSVTTINTTLLYVGSNKTRPDGYKLKYIACEQSSKPSSWATNWNRIYNNSTSYQWPTYWNAGVKDWVFVYNNDKADTYWTGRVLEEFPNEGTKEGYTFSGWYSDSALTNKVSVPLTLPTQIPCLYAKWSLNVTLFVYDLETLEEVNLGTHAISSLADIPSNKELGYAIEKWYLDEDCTIECTDFSQIVIESSKLYSKANPNSVHDFEYTGAVQKMILRAGTYMLECWGAQGVNTTNNISGTRTYDKGGYASGVLKLTNPTTLYIYVGGRPYYDNAGEKTVQSAIYGGWNGGGGKYSGSNHNDNGPGAGATDICLVPSEMTFTNNSYRRTNESYLSRLIVAGGAGGGRYDDQHCVGGYCPSHGTAYVEKAAGMTSGAGFGYGIVGTSTGDDTAGGGAGWYGGGGNDDTYGGGGSSFVWSDEHSTYVPANYSVSEAFKMTNVVCKAGDETQENPDGTSSVGHSGNGYAKITKISQD